MGSFDDNEGLSSAYVSHLSEICSGLKVAPEIVMHGESTQT